jgi:hypothetical protein
VLIACVNLEILASWSFRPESPQNFHNMKWTVSGPFKNISLQNRHYLMSLKSGIVIIAGKQGKQGQQDK